MRPFVAEAALVILGSEQLRTRYRPTFSDGRELSSRVARESSSQVHGEQFRSEMETLCFAFLRRSSDRVLTSQRMSKHHINWGETL